MTVPSGQPRTMPAPPPAPFAIPEGDCSADLALGAAGRLVEACVGLAVPGRLIGP
jgi:hypothetical protein